MTLTESSADVLIVGGGAAALSAAMFSARRGLRTLVVMKDLGGQLMATSHIENYPGIDSIAGWELVQKFRTQAERSGAQFVFDEVMRCERKGNGFSVTGRAQQYEARCVIFAFGLTPRGLGIEREERLYGKGLYSSVLQYEAAARDQVVAVVGGGSAALTSALQLSSVAKQVVVIHRRDTFRGEEVLVRQLATHDNVAFEYNAEVLALRGEEHLEGVVIKTPVGAKIIPAVALIVNIGYHSNTRWLEGFVALNERHEIMIDRNCATSVPGVFAAGDCTDIAWKQVPISSGAGVNAALAAYQYILDQDGRRGVMIDWGGV